MKQSELGFQQTAPGSSQQTAALLDYTRKATSTRAEGVV